MKAKLIKDRLFLKKIADNYTLHRIKDGILTIEGDSHYTIKGIHPFYKLSLKNCQAIERGYDLDELAEEWIDKNGHKWSNNTNEAGDNYGSFKAGFQKALELMGDKKFSEEDVNNAMNWIMTQYFEFYEQPTTGRREHYIQSLQQTEWDVEIEMWFHGTRHKKGEWIPRLDADGCLILKRI